MTKRTSVRARAREIYCELAAQSPSASLQTPLIPAQAGIQGGHATPADECPGSPLARGRAEGDLTAASLTERARALYEGSAVPVAQIAALAGVTERTIYKYAAKQNWRPRYRRPEFAPAKGAGARFIRREDRDKPVAVGLKATDPSGRHRAEAACKQAEKLSDAAQAEAKRVEDAEAKIRAIETNNFALGEYRRWREARDRRRAKERDLAHAKKCAKLSTRFKAREPKGPLPPPTRRDFVIEGVYLQMVAVALSRLWPRGMTKQS